MKLKQLICRHKYADKNLMCKHDKARGVFVFRNFCVKCGYESLHEIDEYALYIAAKADSKLSASDVRPVVRGRWIDVEDSMLSTCSVCGFSAGAYTFQYCPNCGAKMDKEG